MSFPRLLGAPLRRLSLAAVVAALVALALPALGQAHSSSRVIAVDYEARLARAVIADGVEARVIDGNRKLELKVRAPHTALVLGYGGEPFLRFAPSGVWVNERSLTAVTNRLTREGSTPALDKTAPPRWRALSRSNRFAWHDHRLALVPGSMARTGRVGTWSIPVTIDGQPLRIEGGLWHHTGPPLWPWPILLVAATCTGVFLAVRGAARTRRAAAYTCVAVAGAAYLLATSGFTLAHSSSGTWVSVSLPLVIAVIAVAVFVLRPELRYAVAGGVGLLVLAESVGQLSVFRHGYVISALPAPVARAAVAVAVLGAQVASIIAVTRLFGDRPRRVAPRSVKPAPGLAIPKGRRR